METIKQLVYYVAIWYQLNKVDPTGWICMYTSWFQLKPFNQSGILFGQLIPVEKVDPNYWNVYQFILPVIPD